MNDLIIKKFVIGNTFNVTTAKEIDKGGIFDFVENTGKYNTLPHEDLIEKANSILSFYLALNSDTKRIGIKKQHLHKYENSILAKRILKTWSEDFVDEDTGETVSIERNEIILDAGEVIKKEDILEIMETSTQEKFFILDSFESFVNFDSSMYDFKSISINYEKDYSDIKNISVCYTSKNKMHLLTEGKPEFKTPKIFLNSNYASVFHNQVQQNFKDLINSFNSEVFEYLKGKNSLPEQTKLF